MDFCFPSFYFFLFFLLMATSFLFTWAQSIFRARLSPTDMRSLSRGGAWARCPRDWDTYERGGPGWERERERERDVISGWYLLDLRPYHVPLTWSTDRSDWQHTHLTNHPRVTPPPPPPSNSPGPTPPAVNPAAILHINPVMYSPNAA